MFRIYPYRTGSKSVRVLRNALESMIIRLENTRYRYNSLHTIINWGNSQLPSWMTDDTTVLNHPSNVAVATNKLSALRKLEQEGVATVPFTTDRMQADDWLEEDYKVYCRSKLTGHSGEGITVLDPNNDEDILISAPLYTRGVQNHGEYRVHVFNGDIILYQKKSRRYLDEDEVDEPTTEQSDVRNLESGWVYRTGNLDRLERVENLAIQTVEALGLDFGAVDIIMDSEGAVFVLEVNTAPGLGNQQTQEAYVNAFLQLA